MDYYCQSSSFCSFFRPIGTKRNNKKTVLDSETVLVVCLFLESLFERIESLFERMEK